MQKYLFVLVIIYVICYQNKIKFFDYKAFKSLSKYYLDFESDLNPEMKTFFEIFEIETKGYKNHIIFEEIVLFLNVYLDLECNFNYLVSFFN